MQALNLYGNLARTRLGAMFPQQVGTLKLDGVSLSFTESKGKVNFKIPVTELKHVTIGMPITFKTADQKYYFRLKGFYYPDLIFHSGPGTGLGELIAEKNSNYQAWIAYLRQLNISTLDLSAQRMVGWDMLIIPMGIIVTSSIVVGIILLIGAISRHISVH